MEGNLTYVCRKLSEYLDKDFSMKAAQNALQDGLAERANRYPIQAPIRFRGRRERRWREGLLQNISTSGLLIKTRELCEIGTPLEMRFALPDSVYGRGAAEVFCSGTVIRIERSATTDGDNFLAAKIERSQLVRSKS